MYFKILIFMFLFLDVAVKITSDMKCTDLPIQNPTIIFTTTVNNKHSKEYAAIFLKNKNNEVVIANKSYNIYIYIKS